MVSPPDGQKMTIHRTCCLLLALVTIISVHADKPGFQVRITRTGLDYARDTALKELMEELGKLRIPNVQTKAGPLNLTIADIKIARFPRPASTFDILPGRGIRWRAFKLNPKVNAKYDAKMKIWKVNFHKKGIATVWGRDLSFVLDFLIGRDSKGRPTVHVLSCTSRQGRIRLYFKGGWENILNAASSLLKKEISSVLAAQICVAARKQINGKGSELFKSIPMSQTIAKEYVIDFSLSKFPQFSKNDYVQLFSKGTIYLKSTMAKPPFQPPTIPLFPNLRKKMLYVFLTNYLINSGFYAAYSNGKLAINVTKEMLPADAKRYLDTTCSTYLCVGTVFPQLAKLYPNSVVSVDVFATESPMVDIRGNTLQLTAYGEIDAYVNKNGKRTFVFAINVTITASLDIKIEHTRVKFNVTSIVPKSSVKKSNIGNIGMGFFYDTIMRVAIQRFLKPKIAELGMKGFLIPDAKYVKFIGPEVITSESNGNVLVIGTDLKYERTTNSTVA